MKHSMRVLLFTVFSLFFSLSAAFAMPGTRATIMDDSVNLGNIHTIAIAPPNYMKSKTGPETSTVTAAVAQAGFESKELKNVTIIPYAVIADNMKRDTGTDLSTLDKEKAKKVFKQDVAKYADAYLVLTVANDSRFVLFYDLYSAKTGAYLYSYRVVGGGHEDDNIKSYDTFSQLFFTGFADSVKDQYKNANKAKK